ncbi:MAG: hypothetical protein ACRCT8_16540, partial [Lacipirellulaceae bacterium]
MSAAEGLAGDQREVAERYERLEAAALRIADLAEASAAAEGAPAGAARAEQIRAAIRQAQTLGVRERFGRVVELLEGERLAAAQGDQAELAAGLEELLRVVMTDPRESRLGEERRRIERLAKELRSAARDQRDLRDRTESGAEDRGAESLADEQRSLGERVTGLGELADQVEGAGTAGTPHQGEQGGAPQPEGDSAPPSLGERVKRAQGPMQKAEQRLREQDRADASKQQRDAERALEAAQRAAEEHLRQLREEEHQQRLASLADRLHRMHAEEQGVLRDTKRATEAER